MRHLIVAAMVCAASLSGAALAQDTSSEAEKGRAEARRIHRFWFDESLRALGDKDPRKTGEFSQTDWERGVARNQAEFFGKMEEGWFVAIARAAAGGSTDTKALGEQLDRKIKFLEGTGIPIPHPQAFAISRYRKGVAPLAEAIFLAAYLEVIEKMFKGPRERRR